MNLNEYTYLQVRRVRPGPRSQVERLFGVTPFTIDIAYRDFEPIPLQYHSYTPPHRQDEW